MSPKIKKLAQKVLELKEAKDQLEKHNNRLHMLVDLLNESPEYKSEDLLKAIGEEDNLVDELYENFTKLYDEFDKTDWETELKEL